MPRFQAIPSTSATQRQTYLDLHGLLCYQAAQAPLQHCINRFITEMHLTVYHSGKLHFLPIKNCILARPLFILNDLDCLSN